MRKPRLYSHEAALPRMSWAPANLYNLIARSQSPALAGQTSFTGSTTVLSMYQQRWRAKRFLRGYHGDQIPERRFKRWFLPTDLPSYQNPAASGSKVPRAGGMFAAVARRNVRETSANMAEEEGKMPIASLFVREVERRVDTVVFRSCFARSVYEARGLVVQGHVKLNGITITNPNHLLEPSDLISVKPTSIYMLRLGAAKAEAEHKAQEKLEAQSRARLAKQRAVQKELQKASAESDVVEADQAEEAKSVENQSQPAEQEEAKGANKEQEPAHQRSPSKVQKRAPLPPGVLRFELPPFAAPHLFVPPYLEVSFTTCSTIYLRHPTLLSNSSSPTSSRRNNDRGDGGGGPDSNVSPAFTTDIPSPYPANGELFSLAWEHYAKNAPRIRGEVRRLKVEAASGRNGFETQRKKDQWKKVVAVRRGWLRVIGDREKKATTGRGRMLGGRGRQKRGYAGTRRTKAKAD